MKELRHHCFYYLYILGFFYDHIAQWNSPKAYIAYTFFILFVFLKDKSRLIFQVFLLFSIGALLYEAPMLSNHATFYLFSNIVLLIQTIRTSYQRNNSIEILSERLQYQTAVILLASLICVYFWTGLHKLNYGFLDIKESCAIYFNQKILNLISLESFSLRPKYLISTILTIELVVPFMFLFSKLRFPAIIIMSGFHLLLAPIGFYDFSFICFTIYTLFNLSNTNSKKTILFAAILALMSLIISALVLMFSVLLDEQYIIVMTSSIIIQFLIIFEIAKNKNEIKKFKFYISKALIIVLLILNLHSMSPYLGLYTGGTFNMFSNLRTESNLWNHILFPNELRVFKMQNNLYLFEPKNNQNFYSKYEPLEKSLITYNHAQLILNDYKSNNYSLPKIYTNDGIVLGSKSLTLFEKKFSNFRSIPINKTCSW